MIIKSFALNQYDVRDFLNSIFSHPCITNWNQFVKLQQKKNHRVNGVPLDGFWHAIEIFRDEVGMQLLGSSRYIHLNENVKQFCHFENKKISILAQQMCKTIYYFYCNVLKDKYFKKNKHVCLCLVWLIFTYHENRHKEYNERKGKLSEQMVHKNVKYA